MKIRNLPTQSEDWEVEDGLTTYRGCLYIPKDPQLRHNIVHSHHNSTTTGHPGHWKTLELLSRNYSWPGMSHYVTKYIAGCDTCQCVKTFPTQKVGKLMLNKIPNHWWQVISIGLISKLSLSLGYDAILVIID